MLTHFRYNKFAIENLKKFYAEENLINERKRRYIFDNKLFGLWCKRL